MSNIFLSPEDFSTTWGKPATAVININQTTAPDGTSTADQLIDNDGGGSATPYVTQDVTISTTTTYTYSVFAKADQLSFVVLAAYNFTTPANSEAWFNLSTGAVGTVGAGFEDSGIEDYGNGWFRCWVTFTTDAADTAGTCRIYMDDADNGGRTVDLDGTSSIFIWGAYFNVGSTPETYVSQAGVTIKNGGVTRTGPGLSFGMMGRLGS